MSDKSILGRNSAGLTPKVKLGVAFTVGLVVTIATGVVCGRFSNRWGPVPDLIAAGDLLKSMPKTLGDWQLVEDQPIDESVVQMLECSGYVNRVYRHRTSGEEASVSIVVGPAGPISVHTPEICFSSRNYTLEHDRQRFELTDAENRVHSFWGSTFRSNSAVGGKLRVFYAWLPNEIWTAADSPRYSYAGRPLLYKLQAAASLPPGESNESLDPVRSFVQDLVMSGWKIRG
jgi:hypothetical protein